MSISPHSLLNRLWLIPIFLVVLLTASNASTETALTHISEIRKLESNRAAEGLPVEIEAQVVHVLRPDRDGGFFIFDGSVGIFVERDFKAEKFIPVAVGDLVKLSGITLEGNFYPAIRLKAIDHIKKAPLPEARLFYLHELLYPSIDSEWVTVRGRLISMAIVEEYGVIALGLEMNGIEVSAHLTYTEENHKRLTELMFRLVGFDAVAGTIYNSQRQLTDRIFFANSAADFELLQDYKLPEKKLPFFDTHELARVGSRMRARVQTRGIVTHAERNQLYVRGPESSLLAVTQEPLGINVGDVVSMQGFAWPQSVSPAFQAIKVAVVQSDPEPKPVAVVLSEEIAPVLNYELISLEARLVDIGKSFNLDPLSVDGPERVSLLCRSGPHLFEAYLPANMSAVDVSPGARIRLTGICQLTADPRARWSLHIGGLSLQLRSAADIEVLAAAPFWTAGRFLSILGALVVVLILFLVWVLALRRQVEKQTTVIATQVERQTILDERQRIARELHDNLEQGLAGMAIQLRGVLKLQRRFAESADASIRKALQLEDQLLKQHLSERLALIGENAKQSERALLTVQDMLVYCSDESRASILDLRGGLLERMDLPSALQVALEPMVEAADACLQIEVDGVVRRLRHEAERNVFLITREAVSNACRHAAPSNVRVDVVYEPNALRVTVHDDGKGFDPKNSERPGHFGLVGMQERANQLNAQLDIQSVLGEGATVQVVLGDMSAWEKKIK